MTVDFLNSIFLYAAVHGISDIHFEAAARDWNIRIRRQGELEEVQRVRTEIGMEINLKSWRIVALLWMGVFPLYMRPKA